MKSNIKTFSLSSSYEDDGAAGINYFNCICGEELIKQKRVYNGDKIECPVCSRRYGFYWKGMEARLLMIKQKKKVEIPEEMDGDSKEG